MIFEAYSKVFETSMTPETFRQSLDVLLKKPHVVNKRLWGCKILTKTWCKWNCIETFSEDHTTEYDGSIDNYVKEVIKKIHIFKDEENKDSLPEIVLMELLPKAYVDNHAFQLVSINKQKQIAMFLDVTPRVWKQTLCPNFKFTIQLENNQVLLKSECADSNSLQWLVNVVLPQFIKWGDEFTNTERLPQLCNESLILVDTERYYQKYNDLKLKYGKEMVKIWPECTDPSKFVYEDVAIVTYLLLLWEDERKLLNLEIKQTFVDLGCGNGLLVYILTKEGHMGVGIDIRKRKIWNMYSDDVKLEEKTISPSDSHLFPKTDWIIGNHSDELTPWIPVIAARSSYKCNFFLLPCCAYTFDGSKYQRQNSSKSLYTEYLHYMQSLCNDCGFRTDIDRLKIPSTKRICLVGRGRTYPKEEYSMYCKQIQNLIKSEISQDQENNKTQWIKNFKAREKIERVRNCTQIDKNVIDHIVFLITSHLLRHCSLEDNWSIGESVDISEVVQLIPQDKLNVLKSECGGLQTLLKNNHHIFLVQSGKVQLRYPKNVEEINNLKINKKNKTAVLKLRQKPCWFYNNHPHGCPLNDNDCSFLHIKS